MASDAATRRSLLGARARHAFVLGSRTVIMHAARARCSFQLVGAKQQMKAARAAGKASSSPSEWPERRKPELENLTDELSF